MKTQRHAAILKLVRRDRVNSQEQLRELLQSEGFDVTQATLSRDIREMGLVKGGADGAYQPPLAPHPNGSTAGSMLQRALAEQLLRVDRVQQLVLLRTNLGHAQSVCAALDSAVRHEGEETLGEMLACLEEGREVRLRHVRVEHARRIEDLRRVDVATADVRRAGGRRRHVE